MIFKFIPGPIRNVANQIVKKATRLDDEVMNPVRQFSKEIEGGVWTGEDAQAFREEIERDLIPKVQGVIQAIGGIQAPFNSMFDMVGSKDQSMMSMAEDLGGLFDEIF